MSAPARTRPPKVGDVVRVKGALRGERFVVIAVSDAGVISARSDTRMVTRYVTPAQVRVDRNATRDRLGRMEG